MELRKISHLQLFAREWVVSDRLSKKWVKQTISQSSETYNKLQARIITEDDFYCKILLPGIKSANEFMRSGYVNKSGLSKKVLLNRWQKRLIESAERYFNNLKNGFNLIDNKVRNRESKYAKYNAKYNLPFTGRRGIGKGLGPLAALWLTGDKKTVKYLSKEDKVIAGKPVLITAAQNAGKFRKALINKIIHSGALILRAMDMDGYIKELLYKNFHVDFELVELLKNTLADENESLNKLVREYQLDIFEPFIPPVGSATNIIEAENGRSYIVFFADEVFDKSKNQWERKLGLDIQIAIK